MKKVLESHNPELLKALKGVTGVDDLGTIRRVVVDIQQGHFVDVWVELYGSSAVIDLVKSMDGIQVNVVSAPMETKEVRNDGED